MADDVSLNGPEAPAKGLSKALWGLLILALLVAYLMSYLLRIPDVSRSRSLWAIAGMVLNGCIAIAFIVADSRNYSLTKAHWYFILIFFSIAPIAQYTNAYNPWNYRVSVDAMIKANTVVTIWCIVFGITAHFAKAKLDHKQAGSKRNVSKASTKLPSSGWFGVIAVLLALMCMVYLIYRLGFSQLINGRNTDSNTTNWLMWILSFMVPAVPAIESCVCFLLARRLKKAVWIIPGIVLLIVTIICNSPIYSSRYWVAAVYLPIIMAIIPDKWFNYRLFDIMLLAALIIIFPIMYAFKTMTIDQVTFRFLFEQYAGSYNSIDYDAYSLLCRIIDYTDKNGLTLGVQLLSSLLYGFPTMSSRVSVATGELVSRAQGAAFTNVSAPIPAEGYIDFGLAGVIVYAGVIAIAMCILDNIYWLMDFDEERPGFVFPVYLALLAFVIFFMRGALQPVLFRMVTYFIFVIILYGCCKVRDSLDKNEMERTR